MNKKSEFLSQFIINIDVCVIIFGAYWVWELSRKETTTSRPLCYSHPNLQSWKTTLIRHNFVWIWFLINSHEMNMKTGWVFFFFLDILGFWYPGTCGLNFLKLTKLLLPYLMLNHQLTLPQSILPHTGKQSV